MGHFIFFGKSLNELLKEGLNDMPYYKKKLLKITDLIGREINTRNINDYSKTTLIYIYSDGSVEKVVKN